jgi:hypothetical protein
MSDPGRNVPEYGAVWPGSYRDPHWASGDDRLSPGRLSFLEVPLTTDPRRLQPNGFPHELRIESGNFSQWHRPIIDGYIKRVTSEEVIFPCICIFTHNYFNYSEPGARQSVILGEMIRYLQTLDDIEVVPATLAELRGRYVEELGEP